MTVHINCTERTSGWKTEGRLKHGEETLSGIDGEQIDYRVVCLVDAQDENELGKEERNSSVVDYTGLVALHGSQTKEEDRGEEEEAHRHSHCAPRQDFDWQDLSILTIGRETFESQNNDLRGFIGTLSRHSPLSWRCP